MPRQTRRPRYPREEIDQAIDRYVHNEGHRRLLRRRLLDRPTYDGMAGEFGLDVSTIKRIIYSYRDVLGKYM